MAKVKTSVMLDEKVWEEVKIHCIRAKKELGEFLEEVLKKELKK